MTAQAEFDEKYITSTDICVDLGISRATLVNGYRRGALPEPLRVRSPQRQTQLMLWLRAEAEPFIARWRDELRSRRAAA